MSPRKQKPVESPQEIAVSPETPAMEHAKPTRIEVATEREAKALTESVQTIFKSMGAAWFELGRIVSDCLDRQVPHAYGLAVQGKSMNAADWMELCFPSSVPKIYRALRIAKVLKGLPDSQVQKLSEGNAYNLTRLPEKLRTDEKWIERAVELGNEEFSDAVDEALGGKATGTKDKYVTMFPKMPEALEELFDYTEKKLAAVLELDIENKPGLKPLVWERAVTLLFNTGDNVLREAFVGGEGDEEDEEDEPDAETR